jgi:hypothetical protein
MYFLFFKVHYLFFFFLLFRAAPGQNETTFKYMLYKKEELRPETFQLPQTKSFQNTLPYTFKLAERLGAEETPSSVSSLLKPFRKPV